MTLEQYANLADIIGVIVIVVTLIYLTVQVRQGAELLRSESRQAQVANDQNGVYKFVEHPELGRLFSQEETPSFEEKIKLQFWIIGQMRAREHEWLQHRSGAMDEETWISYRDVIYFLLGTKRARALWKMCSPFFNPDFAEMVRTMMKETPCINFWEELEAVK
tara:strand:+ start:11003 stop:11491 length:489 start_codon:yes stop_codon:yes gene_type:complete